ncbi:MAG: RagB/SusD family nutrient uptake outer membrane protein [Chitinophagaceae bacterium]|nr:MAG: RagB/SusD family nutrient uptake outer membrane protein [Chitinophagaceae bacterium]
MKRELFVIGLLVFLLSGCMKDVLNQKPLNIITDKDVWNSESLVEIYLATLYDNLPIGFSSSSGVNISQIGALYTDEAAWNKITPVNNYGEQPFALNTTAYSAIRMVNYFLEELKKSSLPKNEIQTFIGEGHFIRAYLYFDLVRKYGGMPIIFEVQQINDKNIEALQMPRNTEGQVWRFVLADLDTAISDLPTNWDANDQNRANKYTALALKSRAMLYAGSIAKYGSVQLNGLLGIPPDSASFYFHQSLEASQEIISSNQYSLYTRLYDPSSKVGDPVANYAAIFTDENNSEIIFQKAYSYPNKPNSYDNFNIPEGYTTNDGSVTDPTLDMVESYEYINGEPGILDTSKQYNGPNDIFAGKDPRFEASVLHGGSATGWGSPIQLYAGIYANGQLYNDLAPFPLDPSMREVGKSGPFPSGEYSKTGFYIKKYMNMNTSVVEPDQSDQNYIDIRYAEILLNYSEAALELDTAQVSALNAINQIRARAGISLLSAPLTISEVRQERKVELAFEDKRFWDIRRWRIGTDLFRGTFIRGLWPYLIYNNGTYKYIYKIVQGFPIDGGQPRTFLQRDYYSDLSGSYLNTDPKMINNPGW